MSQPHDYDNQQGIQYIQSSIRSRKSLETLQTYHEDENQQGIEHIQSKIRSKMSLQELKTKYEDQPEYEYKDHQEMEYIQLVRRSTMLFEKRLAPAEYEHQQGIADIQPIILRSNVFSDEQAHEHEIKQEIEDIHPVIRSKVLLGGGLQAHQYDDQQGKEHIHPTKKSTKSIEETLETHELYENKLQSEHIYARPTIYRDNIEELILPKVWYIKQQNQYTRDSSTGNLEL